MTASGSKLIAIEGIDGAGKNTLTRALRSELERCGLRVGTLSFPRYGTYHADLAAAALRGRLGAVVDSPEAMALLFALDRAAARHQIVQLCTEVDVLLVDRYVASNAAYTTARLGLQRCAAVSGWIGELEHGELGVPEAAAYVLLPTPPRLAQERAAGRAAGDATRALDAYESDTDLQCATAAAYEELAASQWRATWWHAPESGSAADAAALLARNICALT